MDSAVKAGQAAYTEETLAAYDEWLNHVNEFHWCCTTERLLQHYNENISANHLDVGVGTGYYLDKCTYPSDSPRVALMDLNPDCLKKAGERISRFHPESYQHNVLKPFTEKIGHFDSIGCNYLFHCLPGDFSEKGVVFRNLSGLLNPNGIIFGATVLGKDIERNEQAVEMMLSHNKNGMFNNLDDSPSSLESSLSSNFTSCNLEIVGCVGLFRGKKT